MKSLLVSILVLALSSFSFATTKEDVQQKTADAASAAVDYSKEQKEQFQKDMEGKLSDLKQEIAEMKEAASKKTGAAKTEMKEQIASLEKKQDGIKKDLSKMKKSSGKAWAEMKTGMSKAWDSLADSYKKAKAEFKDKE